MLYSLEEKIKRFAVVSRVLILVIQFVANWYIPDHNAGVFQKAPDPVPPTPVDDIIESVLGGLTRWDAQYFLHIAQYGYTYENTLAFFPLFPLISRYLTYLGSIVLNTPMEWFTPFRYLCNIHSILILVTVAFNNYLFVKTSAVLYRLSLVALKSEKLAYISAILFCVNPASIFFSAAYSESLFCYLAFYGMLKIEGRKSIVNFVVIGLTTAARSNGLVNLGFLIYRYIKLKFKTNIPFFYDATFNLGMVLSVLPFFIYQLYCYVRFCLPGPAVLPQIIINYGYQNKFRFPGTNSTWCNQLVPFAYAYVQKHYWEVGFLNYYQIKQIPNFLLAAPMVYIVVRGVWNFVRYHKSKVLYLGFVDDNERREDELPISAFPYVLHGAALTLFGVAVIHVQVVTRLLASSTPLPYWFSALAIAPTLSNPPEGEVLKKLRKARKFYTENKENIKSRWKTFLFTSNLSGYSFFIKWYFLIYFFVGTVMFSNYFPWT